MTFDKVQAMRNAERHVSQGKIRSAIEEYKLVVEHDSRDAVTLNMLGDLYAKDSNKSQAIGCYRKVAEHYNKQGFSQKAIAVYKKIAKLDPSSVEISGKLAELYQTKGSVSEARSHFATLAEHYQQQGRKTEAVAIWKQISILDPNETDVLLKVAEVCLEDDRQTEAAEAYTEVAARLVRSGLNEKAAAMYENAIAIRPGYIPALTGFVNVKTKLGQALEAARRLDEVLEAEPYNREVASLSVECFLGAGEIESAEKRVIRLIEQEPANYPKLVDLAELYLSKQNVAGATRCLTLSIEHLLLGGKGEEACKWIDAILAADAEQLGALKLRVRYYSWKRDDNGLCGALKKLDETAVKNDSLEDERYALSQLVMLLPQETRYADRLREINEKHGFTENLYDEVILKQQFEDQADLYAEELASDFEFAVADGNVADQLNQRPVVDDLIEPNASVADTRSKANGFEKELLEAEIESLSGFADGIKDNVVEGRTIEKELESVKFYIESGYTDLAETTLNELTTAYGQHPDIEAVRAALGQLADPVAAIDGSEIHARKSTGKNEAKIEFDAIAASPAVKTFDLDEIRTEFGLDEADVPSDCGDYDTHYQLAVAYQEMGLMEDAIKEFQDAISQIGPSDTTRRFFQCSNLLGHCFMQKGMAKLALRWFNRALETPNLSSDEKKGIWYELGEAYVVDGDADSAARYFEQVYAEDVDFRDVGNRLQNLAVNA
jgi:tetratricopeptide (TPR) repeat protein